ncbi:MAG: cytochrome b/b6 domain-containing protein [Gammaproteobacteria bacterium]|nr:cytochrome b/b6 domain-containing protein [Gammaproteobacteria bacterium]MBU1653737.1 cytochrome b/b6 domain-containing protein [Gammaproteobacteria bacterium]MBU1959614.1 cytochrome b/b6 domain-containing protein [Gammaproteobacteria bacterium]
MTDQQWDFKVRVLHWIIAVTVAFQQLTSLAMSDPGTQYLFPYHQWVGILAGLATLLFWLHSYAEYDLPILFPWNRAGRRLVLEESLGLLHGRLPPSGKRVGLSSFVHGLGLLALSGCALTGVVMFSMIPPGHQGPPDDAIAFTRYTLQHKFLGTLLWVYFAGHLGFSLLHQARGNNVLGAIFSLRRQPPP